jgi:hypothetical protein
MSTWWFRAKYIETCNCDHGCPCNWSQIPTRGTCEAVAGYAVTEGAFEDVDLAGVRFGTIASWPGAIHEGGGRGLVVVDHMATNPQQEAVAAITSGSAGPGGPFEILAGTFVSTPECVAAPVTIELEGKRGRIVLGDVAQARVGPIVGALGDEANAHLVLPDGFIFTDALMANAESGRARTGHIDFAYENSNALVSDVAFNVA